MKVDVQGGEIGVLRGASQALTDERIDLMLLEFSRDPELLDYLSRYPLSVFDTEFLLILNREEPDISAWELLDDRCQLSIGREAYRAYPKNNPKQSELYAEFLADQSRSIGYVQTDLVIVRESFLQPDFYNAVDDVISHIETRAEDSSKQ